MNEKIGNEECNSKQNIKFQKAGVFFWFNNFCKTVQTNFKGPPKPNMKNINKKHDLLSIQFVSILIINVSLFS